MTVTIRVTPELDEQGNIFLIVLAEGSSDRIGPLQAGQELIAIIEPPVVDEGGRRPPSKRMKKLSQKQERRIAEDIGGQTQPGSGNRPTAKGDIRKLGQLRVEAKYTFANSYSVQLSELRKILSECGLGEEASLVLDFKDKTSGRTTDSWVLVPYEDWCKKVTTDAPTDDRRSPSRRSR